MRGCPRGFRSGLWQDVLLTAPDGVRGGRSGAEYREQRGGRSWQIISAANSGMQEYLFKFVRGNHLIQVSVIGYRMSLSSARAVAAQAGNTQ